MNNVKKIIPKANRPKWVGLNKIFDEHETEVFKMRFSDWEAALDIDWKALRNGNHYLKISQNPLISSERTISKKTDNNIKVDIRALYMPESIWPTHQVAFIDEVVERANRFLQSLSCYVFHKGTFVSLPKEQIGHFHSSDCYIFLCLYRIENTQPQPVSNASSTSSSPVREDPPANLHIANLNKSSSALSVDVIPEVDVQEGVSLECVLYFWCGPQASKLANCTFKLKTRGELEQAMKEAYDCPVRIVYLDPGKEPITLLAHLNNRIIVHKIPRIQTKTSKQQLESQRCLMYHLKVDPVFKTVRAVQVEASASVLVSRDCFLVVSVQEHLHSYLWIGKGVSKSEFKKIQGFIPTIVSYCLNQAGDKEMDISIASPISPVGGSIGPKNALYRMIQENYETPEFWDMFGEGKLPYSQGTGYYYAKPVRVFKCGCTEGFFAVEELFRYQQSDFKIDACYILDPGHPKEVFVWVGSDVGEAVRLLTLKSVEVWFENLDDGRVIKLEEAMAQKQSEDSLEKVQGDIIVIRQGREPVEFRAYFHGWDTTSEQYRDPRLTYLGNAKN